ncbi:hypothetical protein LLG95_01895 [bacterium]|nr:hypothetical protein [bacterium]
MANAPQTSLESPAPPEFQFIEDPQIAELLRGLSSRWPFLIAADHPLTEFFIRRIGRPGVIRPLIYNLRWLLYVVVPLCANNIAITSIRPRYGWFVYFLALLLIGLLASMLPWTPHVVSAMKSPEDILSKDPAQNCWIWLSGMSLSSYIAIVAAVRYWSARELYEKRVRVGIIYLAINILVFLYFRYGGFSRGLQANAIQWLFLGPAVIWFVSDPVFAVYSALRQIGVNVGVGSDGVPYFFIAVGMLVGGCSLIAANYYPFFLEIALISIPILCIVMARRSCLKHAENVAAELLEQEETFIARLVPDYK